MVKTHSEKQQDYQQSSERCIKSIRKHKSHAKSTSRSLKPRLCKEQPQDEAGDARAARRRACSAHGNGTCRLLTEVTGHGRSAFHIYMQSSMKKANASVSSEDPIYTNYCTKCSSLSGKGFFL